MTEQTVLKSQANEVLDAIQKEHLRPSEFEWSKNQSGHTPRLIVSTLTHKPTGFHYVFDFLHDRHYSVHSPGIQKAVEESYPGNWGSQMACVSKWLKNMRREIESPDIWSAIALEKALSSAASNLPKDNAQFSEEERERIALSLREISEYLHSAQSLNERQSQIIGERLSYLEGASNRLGRKDWIMMVISILTSIIIEAMFSPDQARELFRFAGCAIKWLLPDQVALPLP